METFVEQRRDTRTQLTWPVSIWLPQANRFFSGRSINISRGGVLINVPMSAPVRPGHIVELNFPRTITLAKRRGQFARIKSGRVVRVDRGKLLRGGKIDVAVQFVN
jgi:hypothetical protein